VFPVAVEALPGTVNYHDVCDEVIPIGSATVTSFSVPHVGPTNGYRVDGSSETGGGSVAFICDHQQPVDGSLDVPDDIVAACAGVDVLIHDSQYDDDEFAVKADWGHCTPDFALEVARRSEVKRLVLFHHDPSHDDQWIHDQVNRIQALAGPDIEVVGAAEGMTIKSGD
jgi:phosphoribosyl 1,2-cyclic phosphodiesterase